jgi:hypothetical protein
VVCYGWRRGQQCHPVNSSRARRYDSCEVTDCHVEGTVFAPEASRRPAWECFAAPSSGARRRSRVLRVTVTKGLHELVNGLCNRLAPDGALWFGAMDKEVARLDEKSRHVYTMPDGLWGNYVAHIFVQPDGSLLFSFSTGRSAKLSRCDGQSWADNATPWTEGCQYTVPQVFCLMVDNLSRVDASLSL